jgi:hypothetical protein
LGAHATAYCISQWLSTSAYGSFFHKSLNYNKHSPSSYSSKIDYKMLRLRALRLLATPTFAALGSLTLPPPTGPYSVGQTPYVLDHISTNDPFWPNNVSTSVLVNLYYPTLGTPTPTYYIWEGFSKTYDDHYGVPAGSFRNMTADLAFNAPPLPNDECEKLRLPTLMFGPPGAGPSSRMFTGLLSELASHGYIIVTVDHPYEQPYLEYPDGRNFTGVLDLSWDGHTYLQQIYDYRLTDNSALLDAMPRISNDTGIPVNLTHFVFFGHSVGATVALNEVLVERNRTQSKCKTFLGAINMDGSVDGAAHANDSSADLHAPSLFLKSSVWLRGPNGPAKGPPRPLFESHQSSWTKELRWLGKVNHTDFTDTIFLKHALGVSGGAGAISASRMLNTTRTFVKAFMDMVSQGEGGPEGLLSGDSDVTEKFPEVVFDWNGTGDPCAPDLC